MTTIKNETLIAIFIPVLSLNIILKMTKLIDNDTAKKVIAKISFNITKNTIPITNRTLDAMAKTFNIRGLICVHPLLYLTFITNMIHDKLLQCRYKLYNPLRYYLPFTNLISQPKKLKKAMKRSIIIDFSIAPFTLFAVSLVSRHTFKHIKHIS